MSAAHLDDLLGALTQQELEELRRSAPTSLVDQLTAASRDATAVAAYGIDLQSTEGHGYDGIPGWLRLGALDALLTWAQGLGSTCIHDPSPKRPEPVHAAAWRPGLVSCTRCVAYLFRLTGDADARCDCCGRVTDGVEAGDPIYPSRLVFGALVYHFGTCPDCHPSERTQQ